MGNGIVGGWEANGMVVWKGTDSGRTSREEVRGGFGVRAATKVGL